MRLNDASKERLLKKKYNLSLEDYERMRIRQKYRCALCFRQPSKFAYELAVDHCHSTGKIRGLLCHSCNAMLVHYRDLEYFKRVVKYLELDNKDTLVV